MYRFANRRSSSCTIGTSSLNAAASPRPHACSRAVGPRDWSGMPPSHLTSRVIAGLPVHNDRDRARHLWRRVYQETLTVSGYAVTSRVAVPRISIQTHREQRCRRAGGHLVIRSEPDWHHHETVVIRQVVELPTVRTPTRLYSAVRGHLPTSLGTRKPLDVYLEWSRFVRLEGNPFHVWRELSIALVEGHIRNGEPFPIVDLPCPDAFSLGAPALA